MIKGYIIDKILKIRRKKKRGKKAKSGGQEGGKKEKKKKGDGEGSVFNFNFLAFNVSIIFIIKKTITIFAKKKSGGTRFLFVFSLTPGIKPQNE